MVRKLDNHSIENLARNTEEFTQRLRKTGQPEVLTVNGEARIVVQDAESYQKLLDRLEYSEAAAGIKRGLDSMSRGEGRPFQEVVEEVRVEHESNDDK